jgi:endonuclease/exonuclease/phosphatase family metal-dependent hydrolase
MLDKKRFLSRFGVISLVFFVIIASVILLQYATNSSREVIPEIRVAENRGLVSGKELDAFRVMTLNLAHGRGGSFHQALCAQNTIKKNLDTVLDLLERVQPVILALQEADAPSIWSGDFSHLNYIGERCNLKYFVQGEHVSGAGLHYGSGIMSRYPLSEPLAYTFAPSPPTFSKGFTLATLILPGGHFIDVVSLHVDFASESVRGQQIRELVDVVKFRKNPLVVMGDFNSQWNGDEDTVRECARKLGLRTWKPKSTDIVTFKSLKARLDYIFISDDLQFVSHQVLPDVVSDHQAVVAELKFKSPKISETPE